MTTDVLTGNISPSGEQVQFYSEMAREILTELE